MDECTADGVVFRCEESFIDTTCAAPTPPPTTDCTPPGPEPAPCCTPESYTTFPLTIQNCRWDCKLPNCPTGTVFADNCFSVSGLPGSWNCPAVAVDLRA